MTINKSNGQTLDYVGLYLPEPAFTHGHLYVALSRARGFGNKTALASKCAVSSKGQIQWLTKNIVFTEIFCHEHYFHNNISDKDSGNYKVQLR